MRVAFVYVLLLTFGFVITCGAQTSCAGFTNSKTLSLVEPADTTQHNIGGQHAFGLTPVTSCIYSSGNSTNCDTECLVQSQGSSSINPIGTTLTIERGSLTVLGTHNVSGGWNRADGTAFGAGLSCTGQLAGAAVNCFNVPTTQQCFVNVSITAVGVSVNTNATTVWNSGPVAVPNTCATEKDPTKSTAGGGLPPDPCLNGATVGPTGELTSTGGGGGGGDAPDCSPIIVDTTGNGFHLTSAADGVLFDIRGDGHPVRLGWPAADSGNAFLALPGSNGIVNDGTQLFGNFTPQPDSSTPNGFAALAVYDQPDHGGNGDGIIDSKDQIFSSLRLWTDDNHDGMCQPNELHRLPELSVMSISLQYSESGRTDQFGNFFRFKAKINTGVSGGSDVGPKAYDVFLTGK